MVYTLSEIANAMNAELFGNGAIQDNFKLLIDSRTLTNPENSIFFALRSNFNDGHRYIPELIEKGVGIFVVDSSYSIESIEGLCFLKVENTQNALQKLAIFHRQHFHLPVIGITGSNGKTIVKEWLLHILGEHYKICSNPKSYNSQIGVPLSVWQLKNEHTLAIFEAGISTMGEMKNLESIIHPEIGILTHLGSAHNEGFDNPEQKLDEKLKLFEHCKTVFTNYNPLVLKKLKTNVLTFGYGISDADLHITGILKEKNGTLIQATYQNNTLEFRIPFMDDASIENACLCCLVSLHLNLFHAEAFNTLRPVSMRMELKKGIHGCILVNDSYSNDLNALSTALSFLQQQAIHPKLTVILSDIEESGLPAQILYQQVINLLKEKKVTRLIGIGQNFCILKNKFSEIFEFYDYETTAHFLQDFYRIRFHEESVLIKGARKFEFEQIVKKLEQESHGTVLEINLSAALKNLNAIKNKLPHGMKVMAMVKAFAYGSGSYEIAKLLQNKVDYLAVAYADEGVSLRKSGIQTPIMVLNTDEDSIDQVMSYNLEPVIFSLSQLKSMARNLVHTPLKIHIEIDTGMHRLGFTTQDTENLVDALKHSPLLQVASVFSHLSASDEEQYDDFSKGQFTLFNQVSTKIEQAIGYSFLRHISNTSAALRFDQKGLDMVRLGIGLYGIDPTGKFEKLLEPVFTFKTHISQIKVIQANDSIGYSRKSISTETRKIAVLALGYADGLNRALSNGKGGFYISNQFAPIAGNVCMDMCMVDVSNIDCQEGDEAILFGKDQPISDLASALNTIPYELLTSISQRVKRVYISE